MALRARIELKGSVPDPFCASQSRPGPGSLAKLGSTAIQIIKGKSGSLASALALTNGARIFFKETLVAGSVSTVREPETNCRAAVATARRTTGSGSEADSAILSKRFDLRSP